MTPVPSISDAETTPSRAVVVSDACSGGLGMLLAREVQWVPIVAMERLYDRMREDATVRSIVREMLARSEKHEAEILSQNTKPMEG